ncbi:hypothetical protein D0S48_08455 [Psychrobacillus sp. AK 1817]|uniref:hypothetical protein n=1 Tax=Psychrobacillus sp. AK 1817 TaxID=2303505 RepID=UPI0012462918|nr:hypothetical protein [Psychrobacillus sp. AK 1817]QEY20726.1 hypothetical protein D0S48_08455 [Psychrobacillus sp. AK 1817]
MKKKAIKIAASTAVAASAFVAAAPVQQADAATNVNQLATNAQNAGTVLKWAISYEGSADFKTRPFNEFNAAKKAVAAAEAAANKLSATEKLAVQAKLVDAKVQIVRATAYIDAITSSEKIKSLTSNLTAATASGDLGKVETAYHAASFEYKKQAKLLDRVYGQSTRDGIRNAVKPAMESALDAVKYDVTVKMHLDKASTLIKESKLEEAAAELAKADYNLTLKDAKFTFKSQLEKSYADVAASLPLQAISAIGDGANTVTVKFSKAYTLDKNLTTLEAGQFKINGLTVQSAKLSEDKKSVILTTSTQKANTEYTVTWQGKSVSFKTAAVADTSGIAVNQTDDAFLETTQTRVYEATLTNTDGSPYVGAVEVRLLNSDLSTSTKDVDHATAVVSAINGTKVNGGVISGVTDQNGKLVFTVAPGSESSVLHVQPKIIKKDGDKKSKYGSTTHFFELQDKNVSNVEIKNVNGDLRVDAANDYIFGNNKKFKWDSNDVFFIRGQQVSQSAFETALSTGDTLTIDYNAKADGVSSWNITVDVTVADVVKFTNPAKKTVTYDGYNYDLSGKANAGYTVKIYRNGTYINSTVADSSGNWTLRAVNLTQEVGNTFTAYQYAPGKDGVNGANNEGSATTTINEGAFASTKVVLDDKGDKGLSIGDALDFTFLHNDSVKNYGHEFKKDLTGTITIGDGLGKSAVVNVSYVDGDTLKVTGFKSKDDTFKNDSASLTILSVTGLVNSDQLGYSVAVSEDNDGIYLGSKPAASVPGSTVVVKTSGELAAAIANSNVGTVVLDAAITGAPTVNRNITIDLNGYNVAALNVTGGTVSLVNSGTVTAVNANGGNVSVGAGATVTTLTVAANTNTTLTNNGTITNPIVFNTGSSVNYKGYTVKSALAKTAVDAVVTAQTTTNQTNVTAAQTAVTNIVNADDATVKTQLQTIVTSLQSTLDAQANAQALADANTAVNAAVASLTDANIDNAVAKIAAIPAASATDELTKISAALTAYKAAAPAPATTANLNALQTAVDAIPAGSARKDSLQTATVSLTAASIAAFNAQTGTVVLPTVPTGYTVAVKTTSDVTKYDMTGKAVGAAADTANVVFTVTHTATGKTADSASVVVTVAP